MTSEYERIERAIEFIDEGVERQPTVPEVASHIGLSTAHFSRLFRRWAGIPPKRFLQYLTLEHAKQRLDRSRSVLAASYETGLSGPSRLHDLFVTLEAMTPGEHRSGGAGLTIRWGVADSPFGAMTVASTDRGICFLAFDTSAAADDGDGRGAGAPAALAARWPKARLVHDAGPADDIARRIFGRRRGDDAAIRLHVGGTNFQVRVWEALLRVPAGAVVCYQDVAASVGRPDAVRAVAGAIARNDVAYLIPCHRVIRKLGAFGGYRWGEARKRAMLAWEASREACA